MSKANNKILRSRFILPTERDKSAYTSRSVLSFFLLYKVIFFADAKSDISLTGSDIARLYLTVIFYSP